MDRKNTIITGGAGFIDSHLAEKIASIYDKIYLIDNFARTGSNPYRNINHLDTKKFILIEKEVSEVDFNTFKTA